MRIGYACMTVGVADTKMRTCRLQEAAQQRLGEIITHNLQCLDRILDYNEKEQIRMFRISSDIVPLATHPLISYDWEHNHGEQIRKIGQKIKNYGMRVSMHPGQYTLLTSPDVGVVERSIHDLEYHCRFLDLLDLDATHKVIMHIGGAYGNKQQAVERFASNYEALPMAIKQRVVIENDDRIYSAEDVYAIACALRIPMVFDNLHHQVLPSNMEGSEREWIMRCKKTWTKEDGRQKIHYAQQSSGKKPGAHSETITLRKFLSFCEDLGDAQVDIMLEVKDKNRSAVKGMLGLGLYKKPVQKMEEEWGRYKYLVLEHSHANYLQIRTLLKNKKDPDILGIYELMEEAMQAEVLPGGFRNAAAHVWGYFKDKASVAESRKWMLSMQQYEEGKKKEEAIKRMLYQLAQQYQEDYLLSSYYF